jgi:hypothetical protein
VGFAAPTQLESPAEIAWVLWQLLLLAMHSSHFPVVGPVLKDSIGGQDA